MEGGAREAVPPSPAQEIQQAGEELLGQFFFSQTGDENYILALFRRSTVPSFDKDAADTNE